MLTPWHELQRPCTISLPGPSGSTAACAPRPPWRPCTCPSTATVAPRAQMAATSTNVEFLDICPPLHSHPLREVARQLRPPAHLFGAIVPLPAGRLLGVEDASQVADAEGF